MSLTAIITTIVAYITLLFAVAYASSRNSSNASYFTGNRGSSWWVAMLSMVSAAMSGVTFISIPGSVAASGFSYLQMVIGFIAGYLVIAFVLVPLFYRLKVTSLYEYLESRFGNGSHLTGASFFLLSRTLLSALRAYVACTVLQMLIFDRLGLPFAVNATIFMALVWLYSHRGGVKTIIWTDALRTISLVGSLVLCIALIAKSEHLLFGGLISAVTDHPYSQTWFIEDWNDSRHLLKQLLAGLFMVVAMTGLDQDMMQRTLSCRSKRDAQKNLIVAVLLQSVVIALFLTLGVLLYIYLDHAGISAADGSLFPMRDSAGNAVIEKADWVFPFVATSAGAPLAVGILFVLGLFASTFSAAGSALTALTTSFTVDLLRSYKQLSDKELTHKRERVNIGITLLITALIITFDSVSNRSIIDTFYSVASYTYGPILGMFTFGIISKRKVRDSLVPAVAISAPLIALLIDHNSEAWFNGYQFGFEILIINALITIGGLMLISHKTKQNS